jgi:hypothetical protein
MRWKRRDGVMNAGARRVQRVDLVLLLLHLGDQLMKISRFLTPRRRIDDRASLHRHRGRPGRRDESCV